STFAATTTAVALIVGARNWRVTKRGTSNRRALESRDESVSVNCWNAVSPCELRRVCEHHAFPAKPLFVGSIPTGASRRHSEAVDYGRPRAPADPIRFVSFATVYPPRTQRASAIAFALAGQLVSWGRATAAQLPDSQHILRSARSAQAEFESLRRHNLPREPGHGGADCDERVGRFCYWYDDDGETRPPPPPPPEAAAITRARDRLLTTLDSAALALPGDAWIAGQRVRYLL